MATDPSGNVLLFGFTSSNGFPTTNGAYQETYIGGGDAYVTEMDAFSENLTVAYLYSTDLVQGTTYHWSVIPYDGCTDGQCTTGTASFRVNSRPFLEQMGTMTLSVGKAKRVVIRGEDPDHDDVLVYGLINPPKGMTIDSATGSLAWTPSDPQEGEWSIKVRVGDGMETVDMSFRVIVESGEGLHPMVVIVIAGFSILLSSSSHWSSS